ncbi:hypothetical protein FACS1894217_00050 [Clostridia bacterium]|nr:hypothetical protein FACS1894217_00050 [Clostridia bacterium]
MGAPLRFILLHSIKNQLLYLRQKPGRLILYIILALAVGASLISTAFIPNAAVDGESVFDITGQLSTLKLIFLAYMLLFMVSSVIAGVSTGGSFFEMADVNLLFGSPVNPKQTLVFGLLRSGGKSLLVSVFVLFAAPSLSMSFGVTTGQIMLMFGGYVLGVFLAQIVAVCLYMFTNGRAAAKNIVKIVGVLLLVPTVLTIAIPYLNGTAIMDAIDNAMNGGILFSIPIAGWIAQASFGVIQGDAMAAIIGLGLVVLAAIGMFIAITAGKSDYYEDVLVATETAFEKKRAISEGNLEAAMGNKKNVKVKEAPSKLNGDGARVFYNRHVLETSRGSRFGFLDSTSVAVMLTGLISGLVTIQSATPVEDGEMVASPMFVGLLTALVTIMFMRIMFVGMGRGMRDLFTHHIFLVPEPPMSKIIWSNMEVIRKSLFENAVVFAVLAIVGGGMPVEAALCMVVTTLFVAVLVSVNLFSMRLHLGDIGNGLLIGLYMMFVILIMAPGAILAVVAGLAASLAVGLLVLVVWQLALAVLFFYLSRNVLHTCDMETVPNMIKKT